MKRILCMILSLMLVFLVACGSNNGTASGDMQNGGNNGRNDGSSMNDMAGNGMGNAADNNGSNGMNSSIGLGDSGTVLPFSDGASVMINDKVYMLTGEIIRTDELGTQILATSGENTSGMPSANGEGYGISRNTKVYQIKNNETNDSVAVEIEGVYYRATLHETNSKIGDNAAKNGSNGGMENTNRKSSQGLGNSMN